MAEDGGSYWVSTLVGLIFMLVVSPFFPVGGPIVGGIIGGYLGPPGAVRGALGGLMGGLIVAAIFSIIAVIGGTAFLGPIGTLIGLGVAALLFVLLSVPTARLADWASARATRREQSGAAL